jgi:hypothetical protein
LGVLRLLQRLMPTCGGLLHRGDLHDHLFNGFEALPSCD